GTGTGQVTLWQVANRQMQATIIEHEKAVVFAEFSPDGKLLVTGGLDDTIKLWNRRTLELRATLPWTAPGYAFSATFTPDSRTLAIGGGSRAGRKVVGEVKLWDVATAQCRATLAGQSGPIAFSPDGAALVTVQPSGQVRRWQSEK
ncbi:MAG TPA: hypothetical protein VFA18_07540, partial [Gemmataceae bacterium]|nr:hypothetical protein [Gemmataceae bacterium]